MTFVSCVRPDSGSSYVRWIAGFSVCAVLFFVLLIVAILKNRRSKPVPQIFDTKETKLMRYSVITSMGLKAISELVSVIVGILYKRDDNILTSIGLILMEIPSCFVCTCYSAALNAWMTLLSSLIAVRYSRIFSGTRISLIVHNVLFYAGLLCIVVLVFVDDNPETLATKWRGILAICRDFSMCLMFVIFVIVVNLGIGSDASTERSLQKPKIVKMISALAVCLLVRGIVICWQVSFYGNKHNNCNLTFFIMRLVNEIIIEGFPLTWLMFFGFSYLSIDVDETVDLNPSSFTDY